jgi:hypothetical protein
MTVQLADEKVALKKARSTPVAILQRLGSMRMSYGLVLALACWFVFIAIIYALRVLRILDAR